MSGDLSLREEEIKKSGKRFFQEKTRRNLITSNKTLTLSGTKNRGK